MGHSHRAQKKHNALNIRLTESAVFLPVDTFAPSRRHTRQSECRTSTLRGLLVLDLVKSTRISSIDIELTAMTSTAWPEGIGARRIDVTEDHQVFHASTVFFSGSKVPQRRALSIGPGIYSRFGDYPEDDEDVDELEGGWEALRRQSGPHPHYARSALVVQESNGVEAGPSSSRAGAPSPAPIQREATTSSRSTADSFSSFSYPEPRRENRRFSVDATHIRSRLPYETRQVSRGLSPRELEELAPIPPYSAFPDDSPAPASATALSPTHADPAQSLEEFRNSLHSNLRNSQPHLTTDSSPTGSASSLLSAPTADTLISRQASTSTSTSHYDAEPALRIAPAPSPRRRSFSSTRARAERRISQSTSTLPPIQAQDAAPPPLSPAALDKEKEKESRGRKRFSLTNIFKHAKAGVSRERTHDRERSVDAERPSVVGRVSPESPLEEMEEEAEERPARSKSRGRGVIGRILKDNLIDGGKENEDWTEFKPGTYSYPISFSIPSNAPPTMRCEYGSVVWQLKANVHRPGAFKTKLTATRDVNIIVCPTEEDTEDTENIIVERQWEQQLQYLIAVSGRSFYIGGTMPVMFTLMPLTKMKIFRLSIFIEERVDYYTNMRRIARSDLPTRVCLLSVKGGKGGEPILPLDSDAPDALRSSPLFPVFDPAATEGELSEIASNLMGPGPWTFHQNLALPKSCEELRFTNKNRRSNIEVTHLLKVVMRVQRGDDEHVDPKTGKRKLFDIVVQTPVVILSCRCNPEWMALPRYAEALEDATLIVPSCPCQDERARILNGQMGGGFLERMTSRRSSDSSSASAAETTAVHPHSPISMRRSTYTDAILQSSSLFERLVSGQESVSGEVPPAYDPAACAAVVSPVLAPSRLTGVMAM